MTIPYCISVIIPTYQRCATVQRALRGLARQTLAPHEYEVIICIDGSDDGTWEMVARFQAPYKLRAIWQPNRGRASACNAGICESVGELLIFLDDDMDPTPGFLEAHKLAHSISPHVGLIGAVPIILDASSPPVVEYMGAKFNRHLEKLAQPGYRFELRDFYSGNFSIRRDILLKVGLFDEAFKIYGNEDLELFLRLSDDGVQLVYSPQALAHQYYTKNFTALARDNIAKGRTAVLLASKHPEAFNGLKLSAYTRAPLIWRVWRAGLLRLSRLWVGAPDWMILFMMWLEKRRPPGLHFYYILALDYFYWLGVSSALRENCRAGQGMTSVAKTAGDSLP